VAGGQEGVTQKGMQIGACGRGAVMLRFRAAIRVCSPQARRSLDQPAEIVTVPAPRPSSRGAKGAAAIQKQAPRLRPLDCFGATPLAMTEHGQALWRLALGLQCRKAAQWTVPSGVILSTAFGRISAILADSSSGDIPSLAASCCAVSGPM